MAKTMLVVESPTKAKKIGGFLGSDFKVVATKGHFEDLPSNRLSVNPKKDFEITYAITDKESAARLRKEAEGCDCVVLAADPDREGEAICYSVQRLLGEDIASERISFQEITQKAVLSMLEFIGFGKPEFLKAGITNDHHHIIVHVRDNPVIEHGARMFGAKSMACKWFMGVYAAHGEMELGVKNVKLRENKCVRLGAPYCEWETKS